MFPVLEESEPAFTLVPLTEEEALLLSRRDACTDISFERWKHGAMRMNCDPRRGSLPVESSPSHISHKSGGRIGWNGMDPHMRIAIEYTKMHIDVSALYASGPWTRNRTDSRDTRRRDESGKGGSRNAIQARRWNGTQYEVRWRHSGSFAGRSPSAEAERNMIWGSAES